MVNPKFGQSGVYRQAVVNLIKHLTIVIYDSRGALTRKLPILQLYGRSLCSQNVYEIAHWSQSSLSGLDSTKQENMLFFVCSKSIESKPAKLETSGQSYKHFTLVNYDSRVVIWGIF